MSGEGEQPQQPRAVPKAPTITSAFINKGAKTFAPKKAVRRRPPAAAAPKPAIPQTTTPSSSVDAPPQTQSQTQADPAPVVDQTEPRPDPAPVDEAPTTAPIPTPATTQDPIQQDVVAGSSAPASTIELVQPPPGDSVAASVPPAAQISVPVVDGAEPDSEQSQHQQIRTQSVIGVPQATTQEESAPPVSVPNAQAGQTPRSAADETGEALVESTTNRPTESANATTRPSAPGGTSSQIPAEATSTTEPQNATSEISSTVQNTVEPTEGRIWNAVNTMTNQEQGPAVPSQPRKPTGRRRRKAATLENTQEVEDEAVRTRDSTETGDEYMPPQSQRPRANARSKRKEADAPAAEEDGTTQPPPKRKRQTRKGRGNDPTPAESGQDGAPGVEIGDGGNVDNAQNGESSSAAPRPKPSRKRKRQSTSQPNGEGEQPPRRKGRPPRAPTPSDAEDEVIDEENFFMDDLARRNIRVGRLSQREKKMREINWEEVKQRQKEKEAEQMNSRAVHAEMERQAQEKEDAVRTVQEQVRYEYVDGEMRIVQGSGQVNYEEIADTRFAEEVVEEDDFTNRITSRSFMRNNKRFPEEFLLPGQGKRWNIKSTQDFYDALRMFGTDFGMMTTLFEGVSRRSLKLKFNREERKNPEVIKEILQQKDTRLGNWDEFLKASGKEHEQYDRVEQIKRELEEAQEEAKRQIEEAKAEFEEERRQKRLAGFMSDEEGGENDGGKKKKGKKGKDKQVTFDDDFEVLEVDENDGWGEN